MIVKANVKIVRWGIILGVFVFLALFFYSETYFHSLTEMNPQPTWKALRNYFARWLPWAFFLPLVFWLVRRFPLERRRLFVNLPLHILLGLFFSSLQLFLYTLYASYFFPCVQMTLRDFKVYFIQFIHINLLTYWGIIGAFYLSEYYRKYREREMSASRLEAQLIQAQLEALKNQLRPHFLFNTLNAISSLVYKKPETADEMISRLSQLIRSSLENSSLQCIPLSQEIRFLENYLELEKIRFEDRLTVEMDIAPETVLGLVPNLLLQPLVENAVRHGLSPKEEGGTVKIRSHIKGARLVLQVVDDGVGFPPETGKKHRQGVGLANTRERLQQLYGALHLFSIESRQGEGATVTVEIPFRSEPDSDVED